MVYYTPMRHGSNWDSYSNTFLITNRQLYPITDATSA